MATCRFSDFLDAYRDGELDAIRSSALERHLPQCETCPSELAQLSVLSQLFMSASQPRLSQISEYRLHKSINNVMEEKLLRMAKVLGAIAACVLVVSSIWLVQADRGPVPGAVKVDTAITPPPWVSVNQVGDDVSPDPSTTALNSPTAAYFLADSGDDAP